GGPDAHDAVDGGGQADGAAGIGTERAEAGSRGDGGPRPPAGSGREALGVPGIAAGAVVRVVGGTTPRELVQVGLADDHGTRALPTRRHRGGFCGTDVSQDLRACRRAYSPRAERLLHGDGVTVA